MIKNYIFFGVQRSGKSWITSLCRNNNLNNPEEHFLGIIRNNPHYSKFRGKSLDKTLSLLSQEFGALAIQRNQLQWACKHFESSFSGVIEAMEESFRSPNYYLLHRGNVLDHLCSLYMHSLSDYANSTQPNTKKDKRNSIEYKKELFYPIAQNYFSWRLGWLFDISCIEKKSSIKIIKYEDVIKSPVQFIEKLSRDLDIPIPLEKVKIDSKFSKISDENDERIITSIKSDNKMHRTIQSFINCEDATLDNLCLTQLT